MLKHGARPKAWHGTLNRQVQVLISALVLSLLVIIFLYFNGGEKHYSSFQLPKQKWNSFDSLIKFHPAMEFRNGTDVIWQIPDSAKAALFLAHGCDGRASNFWDKSLNCPKCVGLPEERLLVLHALARKFAVITISSAGRCWTLGKEKLIVKDIIRWWVVRNKLEKLPLVALGASSGGYFVSSLATNLRFSSITLMIAEGVFDRVDITEDYPPTLFVHMPKDIHRQRKISEYLKILRDKGIDVADIECMEFPLSPNFLADRIPDLDLTVSAKLFELFQNKGFIDKKGYMVDDGRETRWREALRETNSLSLVMNLVPHIQEELNVAFAYHEMTSLQSERIFDWFETHMSIKSPLYSH
ncbi:hypothetical protein CFOL_v3_08678 [Cephalotus follicularis]|uniref:Uncharacterized protein n=1 Tax=Cephalotus follicularis TaxID=3775 RepID=A0A1Q3BBL3_CEPFO|nr:hypothetical protein CFOL_v3_08678 [Cephalotus follicularis]